MLYLKSVADLQAEVAPRKIPLSDETAARMERALLASDRAARQSVLAQALADDPDVAGWALRGAEARLGRTINHVAEAAAWLSDSLEHELGAAIIYETAGDSVASDIEHRLFALATKLAEYERQLSDFDLRLERAKLESLKELAYGASHEINNPLANIAARAQTLLADESDPERERKLSAIHRQAMRAHEMIADLMLFARPPKLNRASCELRQLLKSLVAELQEMAREYDVALVGELGGEPIELKADETQLGVAIRAVLVNALEAVTEGGHVNVAVRHATIDNASWAEISVRDDGPGISDEVRRHMFDPFFSGREAGRGLGFGLSKCWRIVTDHGGQVVVHKPSRNGAEITILLPAGDATL